MAIARIGRDKAEEFFEIFTRFNSDPVVSVGSGECGFETHLELKHAESTREILKILCVDPDPTSHYNNPILFPMTRHPDYPLVKDLIEDKPDLIGNCNLILNWPSPNNDGNSYDIKAILDLNPKMVFLLFEATGSSGSPDLLNWIVNSVKGKDSNDQDVIGEGYDMAAKLFVPKEDLTPKSNYIAIASNTSFVITRYDRFHYRYLILAREDQDIAGFEPLIEKGGYENHDEGCRLM